ncbi:MAG: hypothetical protein IT371_21730 [Deltaproteobacteria bacterium]|nr:hypothetical protein [Deltaproteobacteria bacterium]
MSHASRDCTGTRLLAGLFVLGSLAGCPEGQLVSNRRDAAADGILTDGPKDGPQGGPTDGAPGGPKDGLPVGPKDGLPRDSGMIPVVGKTYYVSPSGKDTNSGTSAAAPFATFNRAWQALNPGDLLLLMDGTYTQTLAPNVRDGQPNPAITQQDYVKYPLDHPERTKFYITIRAEHDGKALIDGQGQRPTVVLGSYTQGFKGSYYVIEGLVAKNASNPKDQDDLGHVYTIKSRNVILRRCSGYNAFTDRNDHVFLVDAGCCDAKSTKCPDPTMFCTTSNPTNVLLEDCVGAGSGRKMFVAYASYVNVVFRRLFAAWIDWRGGACGSNDCAAHWPWGDGIEVYNWQQPDLPDGWRNSVVENCIVFGRLAKWGFSLSPNPTETYDNHFYGDIALRVGVDWDGSIMSWPCPSPNNGLPCPKWDQWQSMRAGFSIGAHGGSLVKDTVLQDLFAWGNAGVGIGTGPFGAGSANNALVRGTFLNNGLAPNLLASEKGKDVSPVAPLGSLTSATDVHTGASPSASRARLSYRYVNGRYQDGTNGTPAQRLWPWPMEERIRQEFATHLGKAGFSVTSTVCEQVLKPNGAASQCGP